MVGKPACKCFTVTYWTRVWISQSTESCCTTDSPEIKWGGAFNCSAFVFVVGASHPQHWARLSVKSVGQRMALTHRSKLEIAQSNYTSVRWRRSAWDRWHIWEVVSWNVPLERDRMLATVVCTTTTELFPVCVRSSFLIHTEIWLQSKTTSGNTTQQRFKDNSRKCSLGNKKRKEKNTVRTQYWCTLVALMSMAHVRVPACVYNKQCMHWHIYVCTWQ